jgi:hypothetical protein
MRGRLPRLLSLLSLLSLLCSVCSNLAPPSWAPSQLRNPLAAMILRMGHENITSVYSSRLGNPRLVQGDDVVAQAAPALFNELSSRGGVVLELANRYGASDVKWNATHLDCTLNVVAPPCVLTYSTTAVEWVRALPRCAYDCVASRLYARRRCSVGGQSVHVSLGCSHLL